MTAPHDDVAGVGRSWRPMCPGSSVEVLPLGRLLTVQVARVHEHDGTYLWAVVLGGAMSTQALTGGGSPTLELAREGALGSARRLLAEASA